MNSQSGTPLVTIVIPTFNRRELLNGALRSVREQTYPHWEVVVVDDDSKDDISQTVAKWNAEDSRILYQKRRGDRKGAPVCRNQGLDSAQGEYVIFLDSDDLLHTRCLEGRVAVMQANPALDFVTYPAELFSKEPGDMGVMWNVFSTRDDLDRLIEHDTPWQTTGPIWRRSFLAEHRHRWDEEALCWQDWEFHVNALLLPVTYSKINFCDHFVRRSGADMTAISMSDAKPDHIRDRSRLFLKLADKLQRTNALDSKKSVTIQSQLHLNNRTLIFEHGLLDKAIEVWHQCYIQKLIHRVRYIEGWVAYNLYSVSFLSDLALRWMNMRWLEYRRSGVNHLARTTLTPAHSYLDDPYEYAKSVSYITMPSKNPDA